MPTTIREASLAPEESQQKKLSRSSDRLTQLSYRALAKALGAQYVMPSRRTTAAEKYSALGISTRDFGLIDRITRERSPMSDVGTADNGGGA